jgi:hypothetical protein
MNRSSRRTRQQESRASERTRWLAASFVVAALVLSSSHASAAVYREFSFTVQSGTYWEFGWDASDYSSGGAGCCTTNTAGRFRVTLGEPAWIGGLTLHELSVVRVSGDRIRTTPRWRYLGFLGSRMYGSVDGVSLELVFDGELGYQVSGGFFADYSSDRLVVASVSTIDNDYLSGEVVGLSDSGSERACEVILGRTICTGDFNANRKTVDYFHPEVGMAGYFFHSAYSSCGGGSCSAGTSDVNIGLVAFSIEGDGFYARPSIPPLMDGDLAIYYSLYDPEDLPLQGLDIYNVPTPIDKPRSVVRYLPFTGSWSPVLPALPANIPWGADFITAGNRLLMIEVDDGKEASEIWATEIDPIEHRPLDTGMRILGSHFDYGAMTLFGDKLYRGEDRFPGPPGLPWPTWTDLWSGWLGTGTSGLRQLASGRLYSHLLTDGPGLYYAVYIPGVAVEGGVIDSVQFRQADSELRGLGDPIAIPFVAGTPSLVVHDFAMDEEAFYIAVSVPQTGFYSLYRVDRDEPDTLALVRQPEEPFPGDRLLIEAVQGFILMHLLNSDPANSLVLLADTRGTNLAGDDIYYGLDLPGAGVPFNLQMLAVGSVVPEPASACGALAALGVLAALRRHSRWRS